MIRALITWLIVFALLLLVVGMIGLIGVYELVLVFLLSLALTVVALRLGDRARSRRADPRG
jgi:membrane protein implicated in regulation of membrane protease activity